MLFDLAAVEGRVQLSEDADFGTLLALRSDTSPSVVSLRHHPDKSAAALTGVLLANLPPLIAELEEGAMVVIERDRLRSQRLP